LNKDLRGIRVIEKIQNKKIEKRKRERTEKINLKLKAKQ
jgi:hypothetical protein